MEDKFLSFIFVALLQLFISKHWALSCSQDELQRTPPPQKKRKTLSMMFSSEFVLTVRQHDVLQTLARGVSGAGMAFSNQENLSLCNADTQQHKHST